MEIIIDGQVAELGNSSPAITKKSIDINNPSARFIDFTNKFSLPDTVKNRTIFNSPKAVGSNNRSYDRLYNIVIQDVFKIFKGKGYLDSGSYNTYELQCVDDSKELFNALETKLNTISWDDKDTALSTTEIDALDTADPNNCWFWGKLCLHEKAIRDNTDQISGGGDARCKYSRPSFNVEAFLKKAIELQGYTYTGNEIQLAFSGWHSDFFFTSYQKTYVAASFVPAGTLALTGLDTNDFEHSDITAYSAYIDIDILKAKFRFRGTIISDATIDFIIRGTDKVDATKITESKITLTAGETIIDFSTSDFQSDNGINIEIILLGSGSVTIDGLLYSLHSEKENILLSSNPFLGYKIKAYDNLPDLTFKDLYYLISVIGNQYHSIDVFSKNFSWIGLGKLNKMDSVDWSDKFIIDSENITSKYSGLFQKNILRYQNDQTVNVNLGRTFFETDNESMTAEGDYIALKFGASYDVKINNNVIGHANIYNDDARITLYDINPRIFSINADKLQFFSIDWNNLKTQYYQNYFNSLYRIRAVDAEFNLNKLDVLSWQLKQLVYIDYFKTTFIVLEINNFIPGRKTKVKLLAYGK
jgi:hypothetical protein